MGNSCFVEVNGLKLHYLDYPGDGQTLILTHGLTANAWSLDPLAKRLSPHFHVVTVDMRGRGLSDKPATGYALTDIASDILGLMDIFGIQQGSVGGHSSGGLLTLFMAATYPDRISKAIMLDAGIMHPKVAELVGPSIARLGKPWPNWESYLQTMKQAPEFCGWWDPSVEDYCRADVQINPDGSVVRRASPETIQQVMVGQAAVNWLEILGNIKQPSLLVNAPGPYGPDNTPAMMPREQAQMTVSLLGNCRYAEVPGNHFTMMYNIGVKEVARAITDFVDNR
ncbi:MAG: alpha/beta fold hydrolase [Aggregatilineales bacterium]